MRTWGRIPVRGTSMTSCGVLASQTHIVQWQAAAMNFYIMNARTKRARFAGKSREGQDSSERLGIMKPTQSVS
jgi:hypothetical protein